GLDAFLIAYLIPSFVLILVMGTFGATLIPALVEVQESQGAEAAEKLFSSMMFLAVVALVGIAIVLAVAAPFYLPFLASGFGPAKLQLTRQLLYALLPFVLFSGFAGCTSAVLNAQERFIMPALAPLLTPLATILLITLASARWGPFVLAAGVVAGGL